MWLVLHPSKNIFRHICIYFIKTYNCVKQISSNAQMNNQEFAGVKYKFHLLGFFFFEKFQIQKDEKYSKYYARTNKQFTS